MNFVRYFRKKKSELEKELHDLEEEISKNYTIIEGQKIEKNKLDQDISSVKKKINYQEEEISKNNTTIELQIIEKNKLFEVSIYLQLV